MYEIFTKAALPYSTWKNEQVVEEVVKNKYRMLKEKIPDNVYEIIDLCWKHEPSDRPSFTEIETMIEKEYKSMPDVEEVQVSQSSSFSLDTSTSIKLTNDQRAETRQEDGYMRT